MANALHDLGDVFHRFGQEIKDLADKLETALRRDAKPAEHAAAGVVKDAAGAAAKAAEETAVSAAQAAVTDVEHGGHA